MIYILDAVVTAIGHSIATHAPERGGALMGLPQRPLITSFLFDEEAVTTGVTYQPSRNLKERVQALETNFNLEFKGVLHSHPGGLDRPSQQDLYELETGLFLNPHLSSYLAPIVTTGDAYGQGPDRREHELTVAVDAKISFFTASRVREGGILLEEQIVSEVPLFRHLTSLVDHFEAADDAEVELVSRSFGGADVLAGRVTFQPDFELLVLTSELYPDLPPVVLATEGGETRQLQFSWLLELPADERLVTALSSVLQGRPPFQHGFGPRPNLLVSTEPERASAAGWREGYSPHAPAAQSSAIRKGLMARSQGLLSDELSDSEVLVVGAGSVGSSISDQLVRSGVGRITVYDHDTVELANLSRSVYEIGDVGESKPAALVRHLLQTNPALDFSARDERVQDADLVDFVAAVDAASIVIAASDDPEAQLQVNRLAYQRGTPSLYVGLTAGAHGGEVIVVVPDKTPCYLCATVIRHEGPGAAELEREMDYGAGRLKGEIALGPDIQHVTTAASKLALSILVQGTSSPLEEFVAGAVENQRTYLTMSMVPDYWMYPQIFEETRGQYAYQSVWLTPPRREECPVCGAERPAKDETADLETPGPTLEAVRAAATTSDADTADDDNPGEE
jgi:molybdopterin/thiamine biosynthesis adenylyltransferase/proteasome lid subunit RPN8/RPN11